MTDNVKEKVFTDVVKSKLEEQLQRVGKELSLVLDELSFLFNSDKEKLLSLIIDNYIYEYNVENNSFHLDFENFSKNTPTETKDKLFELIISQFTKTIDLKTLGNDHQEEKSNIDEERFNDDQTEITTLPQGLEDELPL